LLTTNPHKKMALWYLPWKSLYVVVSANSSSKAAITFQIKVDSLEQMSQIDDSLASSLQHLELVV
jgi:hypothetical protein